MSLEVVQPGILSLLQDSGRYGKHRIGLTTGGPLDRHAYALCNQLLGNAGNATVIEASFGGLQLQAQIDTFICVTGAAVPLHINQREHELWAVHAIKAGDLISLGFAKHGARAYLGVADGFDIASSFGSAATVMRESIGGLCGDKLHAGDKLPCRQTLQRRLSYLPAADRPRYQNTLTMRVVPGYQQAQFSRLQQRRLFSHAYTVTQRCDRMGYRLEGPAIACDIEGILSEGICHGAIQIPSDGQPIVLLADRQTIGGYPKIGAALSLDTSRLAQLTPGATVHFAPISAHTAHNALHMAHSLFTRQHLPERSQ